MLNNNYYVEIRKYFTTEYVLDIVSYNEVIFDIIASFVFGWIWYFYIKSIHNQLKSKIKYIVNI